MHKKISVFFVLIAMVITVVGVWYAQRPLVTKQASWDDVIAEAKTGGYRIITTEELAERYGNDASGLLLVDTRQEWEYRAGHIQGALNFSMEPTRWARWRKAKELKTFLGPNKDRTVVFY